MLRPEEVFADDQVVHAGIVVDVDDPVVGPLRQIGPVVRFRGSPPPPTAPAPIVGADDDRLGDLLASPLRTASAPTRSLGSPLEGLRILDLSAFFATAFGARLLSDLGADVIKIEPLVGDQMRPLADLFECAQRGKRNLAIDLRTTEGVDVVHKLIGTADVIMHNLRPGKAEKLGIGYEQCAAIKPSLIYCYLPGFGSTGPKANLKSFAPLVSGFTGMLYVGAGDGNPPVRRVVGNEDLYNGYLGAMSVLMGVAHRDRTGQSQYIESPHLHSSLMLRTEQCTDAKGGLCRRCTSMPSKPVGVRCIGCTARRTAGSSSLASVNGRSNAWSAPSGARISSPTPDSATRSRGRPTSTPSPPSSSPASPS